jgi:hypothetical protein
VITDAAIAGLLVDLYAGATTFDHFAPGLGPSGICWASKRVDDADVILLRGSVTFWDWFKDLMALAAPYSHETLGPTHPGFTLGMVRCLRDILAVTKGPYIIAGHSLGAGRAAILTGLMVEAGILPLTRVVFGSPKPGFKRLSDYIAGVPGRSYRNGDEHHHDLVTEVPFLLPPEEYVHPSPLIMVSAAPDPATATKFGLFKWHHMPLYAQALKRNT